MFCTNCGVALYEGAAFCSACGRAVGGGADQAMPRKVAYAGFWLRAAAFVIDSLVLVIPTFVMLVLAVALLRVELPSPEALEAGTLPPMRFFLPMEAAFLTVHWLYFALMESSAWQGTLGKRALGSASPMCTAGVFRWPRERAFFREARLGDDVVVGYVMAGFTERKQALHDIIADCIVVKMP